MYEWIRKHPYWFVALFSLALHGFLFFGVFGRAYFTVHATDGEQYRIIAENMLRGNGFSLRVQPPFVPDTIRTPLYPLFLAGVKTLTGSYESSLLITFLLGCALPLFGMRILSWFLPGRRILLMVGLVLALDPHLFYYSFVYGSEGVFLPLVGGAVVLAGEAFRARSWRLALPAGFFMGIAALARPIVQFVPILFSLVLIGSSWRGKRRIALLTATVFVLAYALTVSPWIMRNVSEFGVWDYSNVGWFNMYTRVAATTEALHRHVPFDVVRLEYLERMADLGLVDHRPVEEQDIHGYAFTSTFKRETLETIRRYPREFTVSQVSAFSTVVSQDLTVLLAWTLGWIDENPSFSPFVKLTQEGFVATLRSAWGLVFSPWILAILMRFVWIGVFALSLCAPLFAWRKRRDLFPLTLFLLLYNLGIIALSLNAAAQADARYRAQYAFVQLPLAVFALMTWRSGRMAPRPEEPCPACGTRWLLRPFGRRSSYDVWRCSFCMTVSVLPRPSMEVLTAFYSEGYFGGQTDGYMDYEADKRATHRTLERYLDLLARETPPGRLLDVGAATGTFLEAAQERGWQGAAQEFSHTAAEKLRHKGIEVSVQPLSHAFPAGSFDAVTLLDVIEHVTDPRQTVRDVLQLVRPGGFTLLNTPDARSWIARLFRRRWHAIVPPEHITLFSAASLVRLLESEGFSVAWVGRVPKWFRVSYILSTGARWTNSRFLKACARFWERHPSLNVSLRWPLNDNITVLAKRG